MHIEWIIFVFILMHADITTSYLYCDSIDSRHLSVEFIDIELLEKSDMATLI